MHQPGTDQEDVACQPDYQGIYRTASPWGSPGALEPRNILYDQGFVIVDFERAGTLQSPTPRSDQPERPESEEEALNTKSGAGGLISLARELRSVVESVAIVFRHEETRHTSRLGFLGD